MSGGKKMRRVALVSGAASSSWNGSFEGLQLKVCSLNSTVSYSFLPVTDEKKDWSTLSKIIIYQSPKGIKTLLITEVYWTAQYRQHLLKSAILRNKRGILKKS